MNNSLNHFSKYAIPKKHTLNIIGGIDESGGGSYRCSTCAGGADQECLYGCITIQCQSNRIAHKCVQKNSAG